VARIHILALEACRSGGAGAYTAELIRQLAAHGHQFELIGHQADSTLEAICQIHRLPMPQASRLTWAWRLAPILRQKEYDRFLRALPLQEPDIVIGSAQQMFPEYWRRFPNVPMIYVPHSLVAPLEVQGMPWTSPLQRWAAVRVFRSLERQALVRASRTIRFTRTGCDALNLYYGKSVKSRFIVLPTPIPIPELTDAGGHSTIPKLLYVGRLVESKNVAWLLGCLGRLMNSPWTCDIVGNGEERPRLERIARENKLSDRVVFQGHQEDVGHFYREADLLVFPSRLENSPLVILEAMSYGVPSLSIRADRQRYINANHEIITDDHDGFLADHEGAFVDKLQALLGSRELLREVGARARKTVEKRNRWEDHIAGYERILEEIQTKPENKNRPLQSASRHVPA
jgi:glycosyltransferase involved in cell wall biosynthesis